MAETAPLLEEKVEQIPLCQFSYAIKSPEGKFPQAIAHRGYKAAHPENTMGAFRGAVEVGAHAIETDVHITRDGIVVLSHDATLKRCFGEEDKKIIDFDWDYIKTLRTLKPPHEQMPRLKDLLKHLAQPEAEKLWLLLDIKIDNNIDDIFRLIASTISEVQSSPKRPWNQRIVLGCWAANQLNSCTTHLPGYPITHIGFSVLYARQFLKVPGIGFNMHQKIMAGPLGSSFFKEVRAAKRSILLWTVNDVEWMKWAIRKEADGVITDDPKKFLEVCRGYKGEKEQVPLRQWGNVVYLNLLAMVLSLLFRWKHGFRIDVTKIQGKLAKKAVLNA